MVLERLERSMQPETSMVLTDYRYLVAHGVPVSCSTATSSPLSCHSVFGHLVFSVTRVSGGGVSYLANRTRLSFLDVFSTHFPRKVLAHGAVTVIFVVY